MTTEASTTPETDTGLQDWLVTFVMTRNGQRRKFAFPTPATNRESALAGAQRFAKGIYVASGGAWKLPVEFDAVVS